MTKTNKSTNFVINKEDNFMCSSRSLHRFTGSFEFDKNSVVDKALGSIKHYK